MKYIIHASNLIASRYSVLASCHILELKIDQQAAVSLASFQVQHADERPSLRHIRQPHGRHGKHRVLRPAVVTLDQDSQEHHLVLFELPLQRFVPDWLCDWWIIAFVQQTSDPMVLFVSGGLALWRLAAEIVRVNECAGDVWLHLVRGVVFRSRHVSGTAYMKAETLLTTSTELAIAAGAKGDGLQNIAIGARE